MCACVLFYRFHCFVTRTSVQHDNSTKNIFLVRVFFIEELYIMLIIYNDQESKAYRFVYLGSVNISNNVVFITAIRATYFVYKYCMSLKKFTEL